MCSRFETEVGCSFFAEPEWKSIVEAFDEKAHVAARELRLRLLLHMRFYVSRVPAQKVVQLAKNGKLGKSLRQARNIFQDEHTNVDWDQLRHLAEAMHSDFVSLIDTLVPQIHLAR